MLVRDTSLKKAVTVRSLLLEMFDHQWRLGIYALRRECMLFSKASCCGQGSIIANSKINTVIGYDH